MSFAEVFKAARIEKKLTQQELADKLEMDRSVISHYERGKSTPNFDSIPKICKILDLKYDDIFN